MIRNIINHFQRIARVRYRRRTNRFCLEDLILTVTYRCNLRCQSCYYARNMDQLQTTQRELSLEEIERISRSIGPLRSLLVSGGEPFLRPDLAEIIGCFYRQNHIRRLHLPSNGQLTDRIVAIAGEILGRCPDLSIAMGLPLDGLRENHNRLRGTADNFARVLDSVEKLQPLRAKYPKFKLHIYSVVNNRNLDEMLQLAELVERLPVDGHGPSPLRGSPYDRDLKPPSSEQWRDFSNNFMPFYLHYLNQDPAQVPLGPVNRFRKRYFDHINQKVLAGGRLPFSCLAGSLIGVIEPNADVRLCELTDVVGNLRSADYDFRQVWFSPRAQDLRQKVLPRCVCTHACFLGPSLDLHLPYYLCDLFVQKFNRRSRP